jgi:hypothetical protein
LSVLASVVGRFVGAGCLGVAVPSQCLPLTHSTLVLVLAKIGSESVLRRPEKK